MRFANAHSRRFQLRNLRAILTLCLLSNLVACDHNASEQTIERPLNAQKDNIIVPIKDTVIAGDVRNTKFEIEKAIIDNGILTLRQGKEFFADVSVDIVTFENNGMSEKTFSSSNLTNSPNPHIILNIKKEGQNLPDGITLMSDYELLLIFGERESLGVPFSIRLVDLKSGTNIEGKFFATYKDIQVVDGTVDPKADSFDTLDYLAKEYIKTQFGVIKLGERFGVSYKSYGDDEYPKSGFVGYEVDKGETSLIKIQLAKDESGWKVANELSANQIHQAHPVVVDIEGNLRTVEGLKATTAAARKFESYLNDKALIGATRSTSVRCYLTKTAHKASCRAIYGLKEKGNIECHNVNFLLSNDGQNWNFESEILDTQKVDYNSGELVTKKPFSMNCQ